MFIGFLSMHQWIQLSWDVCRLKKGPQDFPYSPVAFWVLLFCVFILDTVNLHLALADFQTGLILLIVAVHSLVYFGSLALLLMLLGHAKRINQTLTCLLGSGMIISLMAVPLLLSMDPAGEQAGLPGLLLLFLNIWGLIITAHIFRHALSVNLLLAGVLAIGYYMMSIKVVDFFLS